jgi:hypothetical protein
VLSIGLGGVVQLGSSAKQARFWCDFRDLGIADLGQGTRCVSRFDHLVGFRTSWVGARWTGGVTPHSGH